MSYWKNININTDNATGDAFGRLRTSEATTIFDSQFQYDLQPLIWEVSKTGSSTVTHLSAESAASMTTTTTGDYAILQTKQYHRYQPGKSSAIFMTFANLSAQNNALKQVGYFDNNCGIFLESVGGVYNLVRRTKTSGTVVDNKTPQSSWNVDKFDGTGPSGLTINFSKDQIFIIDLQWLGVGRVRVGFNINGVIYVAHEFLHANSLDTTYMQTANLLLRYALSANAPATFKPICSAVVSEAGFEDDRGLPFSASNGVTPVNVNANTTRYHVLTIKPKLTFGGQENRGQIIIEQFDQLANATNTAIYYEVVYNPTFSTAISYTSVDANSIVEYAVGDGTRLVVGGTVIDSGYIAGTRVSAPASLTSKLPLTLSINGLSADNITIAVTRAVNVNTPYHASISWKELR